MNEISAAADLIHRQIWRARDVLWAESESNDPISILDPQKAARVLGVALTYREDLGFYIDGDRKVFVAGLIDRGSNEIQISTHFRSSVQKFTAAHEIGHVVLHPGMTGLHRDRALEGALSARSAEEYEADQFAVHFLMPARLVVSEFERRYLTRRFELNDDTEYALGTRFRSRVNHSGIAYVLASGVEYGGRHFPSLAEFFGLSVETVSRRLMELELC